MVRLFAQDHASIHDCKVVDDWMDAEGVPRDQTFPTNSPDLNFIEEVWGIMAQRMLTRTVSTAEELRADPEITEAIAEGAVLAIVPLLLDPGSAAKAKSVD